ncbi:MAG TPA: hypothetical protein P5150_05920 [Candidatus Ratteibacteria bacterium]|nr:hypothetical protein [bacterium]HRR96251.1 hypothetical protein [Candidatus Ratteibacteria bacterium]
MEKNIDELLESLFKTEENPDIELDSLMKYSYFISNERKNSRSRLKILTYICIFLLISNILLLKFYPIRKSLNSKNEEVKHIIISKNTKVETKYRNKTEKTANNEEIVLPLQNFFEEMDSFIEFAKSLENLQETENGG